MPQKDPLLTPQRRAVQYWYMDGIFELGFGLFCLVFGVYLYIEDLLQETWLSVLMNVLLVVVVLVMIWLMNRFVRWWKERITFPRTGYVSYTRESDRRNIWWAIIGLIIIGAIMIIVLPWLSMAKIHLSAMPLLTSFFFGFVMAFVGWRTGLSRFYWQAGISLLSGIALAFSSLGNHVGLAAFFLTIGCALLVSGVCVLSIYLRQHPTPNVDKTDA